MLKLKKLNQLDESTVPWNENFGLGVVQNHSHYKLSSRLLPKSINWKKKGFEQTILKMKTIQFLKGPGHSNLQYKWNMNKQKR